ncbi:unnamed protein product [Penicillium glandicola]
MPCSLNELSRACLAALRSNENVVPGPIDNEPSPPINKPSDLLQMPLTWSKYLWQLGHEVHNKKLPQRGFTFRQFVAPWTSNTPRSDHAVHIDWDNSSTQPWARSYIYNPRLVEIPGDMVLTVDNGNAMLTPVQFHRLPSCHRSFQVTHNRSANRPQRRLSFVKSIPLASCDGPTLTYCETTWSGDGDNVFDERNTELSSLDHLVPLPRRNLSASPRARLKVAPVLPNHAEIRNSIGNCQEGAVRYMLSRALQNASLPENDELHAHSTESNYPIDRPSDEYLGPTDGDSIS